MEQQLRYISFSFSFAGLTSRGNEELHKLQSGSNP